MSKNFNKKRTTIEIIGGNALGVTGSCSKILTMQHTYLFECGLIQEKHNIRENYVLNQKILQDIKPKTIDAIVVGHCHVDHVGLIPALYRNNCNARIIVPKNSTRILKEMWMDCAFINQRDVMQINKMYSSKQERQPLYTEDDVKTALKHIEEVECDIIYPVYEDMQIRYSPAGHILLSQQTEMWLVHKNKIHKVLFTSDLGNLATEDTRIFVEHFQPVTSADIVIGECTYGCAHNPPSQVKDKVKLRTVIEQYCVERNHRVLIPTFSLDRFPYILWILFSMFGYDKDFKVPILLDSPLANRLLDAYGEILTGEAKEKFDDMMNWQNIIRIVAPEDSVYHLENTRSAVILASSGMLTAGRSVSWVKSILPNPEDCIAFIGYAGEGTLARYIKEGHIKTFNINNTFVKNKAQIVNLKSFSSHMQYYDLLRYYSSINAQKIVLVHSDEKTRLNFKAQLERVLCNKLKTARVVCAVKNMKINM